MKNLKIFNLLLLTLLAVIGGCSKEEISFPIEQPRFELREGYQLLEVIVPQNTKPTDKIYIIGDFNGGMEAVGDPRWQLEKAQDTDSKFGIYINPADLKEGTRLSDGYTFYNAEQGEERSLDNKEVLHHESPVVGTRANVMVYRWADYFNTPLPPEEITHDGYVIYIVDNTGWDEIAMYAWGDAEAFGSWPGMTPTGTVEKDGVRYKYFDTGVANEGLNLNLIFNNNGGGQQTPDYNVTLNQDFYLEVNADGAVEYDPNNNIKHDGYAIFVADCSGWDELYLYMWGTVNDLNGGWPGMAPTGTQTIHGVPYRYFDLGAANCDGTLEEHVILNNNAGKQFDDVVVFNLDHDVYLELTPDGAREIDPSDYTPPTPPNPGGDNPGSNPGGDNPGDEPSTPAQTYTYHIYVENLTGWDNVELYSWGNNPDGQNFEACGGWGGITPTRTQTIGGVDYLVYTITMPYEYLEDMHLIFHDGDNKLDPEDITVNLNQDLFITISKEKGAVMKVKRRAPRR